MTTILTTHPIVEDVLAARREAMGDGEPGYRGHIYRVLNCWRALATDDAAAVERAAVTAAFHDLAAITQGTLDYLPPSIEEARSYLEEQGKPEWIDAVTLAIDLHHKLTPYGGEHEELVETFRKADLVDASRNLVTFGISPKILAELRETFPNAGFHANVLRVMAGWIVRHPLRPVPILRW